MNVTSERDNVLYVLFTMDAECPGEGSKSAAFTGWEVGERAIRGYAETVCGEGWPVTFFVVPQAARRYAKLLLEVEKHGCELGLHIHPQDSGYGGPLGFFSAEEQVDIIGKAAETWAESLGHRPYSFRPGNFSANDYTFPVLESLGFLQGSVSCPERNMISLGSVWPSAPKDPHFAHRANRLLPGEAGFLEIPVTVDWESMIWGGKHPQDLRIESVDARAHGFTIDKNLRRMVTENVSPKTLVPITHNYFDYSSNIEFRAITLKGVIERIRHFAREYGLHVRGATLTQLREIFVGAS